MSLMNVRKYYDVSMILDGKMIKHIHCLGIGGIGVSALAEILLKKGYHISGSDISSNNNTERLHRLGAKIVFNHNEKVITQADCAIYSSAITLTNPEFIAAQQARVPLLKRGQMLAKMIVAHRSIAVAGTHGKTTTSALLANAFVTADLDPTFIVGGVLNDIQTSVRVGGGPYFIAEVDESDASFLYMHPNISIITNIDADHLSSYGRSFNRLKKTYAQFLHQILEEGGMAILCMDDLILNELIPILSQKVITYGFSSGADYRAYNYSQKGLQSYFHVHRLLKDKSPLPVKVNLAGKHNALNALAAIAVGELIGMDERKLLQSLAQFPGVDRRFTVKGEIILLNGQALVIEDYGHHPNEIKETLSAARAAWPERRLILVFQPHRYSRTQELMHDFASVLTEPDLLVLLEVYSAGETNIPGADGKTLLKAVEQQSTTTKNITFVPELEDVPEILRKLAKPNDVIILQGAGSVGAAAKTLIGNL